MCEAVTFFRQALAEEGLDGEALYDTDGMNDTLIFTKQIGGDQVTFSHTVVPEETTNLPSLEKKIVRAVESIAREYRELVTETFIWDGRHIAIEVDDSPLAYCKQCGSSVELEAPLPIFEEVAELSSPQPHPRDRESLLESMDDHSTVCLKMYLMGKLRGECDDYCPNSRHSDINRKVYIGEAHS